MGIAKHVREERERCARQVARKARELRATSLEGPGAADLCDEIAIELLGREKARPDPFDVEVARLREALGDLRADRLELGDLRLEVERLRGLIAHAAYRRRDDAIPGCETCARCEDAEAIQAQRERLGGGLLDGRHSARVT